MDRRELHEALRLVEAHRPFVRAVVVSATGSVPGKPGASMLVREDGSAIGTVGGAALEERVKELARAAFEQGSGGLHHFDLAAWRSGGLPSLCGGSVEIAIEYVGARPHLLLWGGGHVAHALAALLPPLEYDYSVADDREDWVGEERFPLAGRRAVVAPTALWQTFEPDEYTHLFVLGYDARKDLEVLAASIERFPGAIGLIASAAKREHVFASLRDRGFSRESIDRVRSPVGIGIGAESPPEIAVSIVAELVAERHPPRFRTRTVDSRAQLRERDGQPRPR